MGRTAAVATLLRQLPHLGVTRVVGGSGTGKTEIIAVVVAKLLAARHAEPDQIAVLCASVYEAEPIERRIELHGVNMFDMTELRVRHVSALAQWCAVEGGRSFKGSAEELLLAARLKDALPLQLQRAAEGAPQRVLGELLRTFHALQHADFTPRQVREMAAAAPSDETLSAIAETYTQYLELKFDGPLSSARDRVIQCYCIY